MRELLFSVTLLYLCAAISLAIGGFSCFLLVGTSSAKSRLRYGLGVVLSVIVPALLYAVFITFLPRSIGEMVMTLIGVQLSGIVGWYLEFNSGGHYLRYRT